MKGELYKIEDIYIGDEVTFLGTPAQSDYGQSWEVIGIDGGRLQIQTLEYYAPKNNWIIELDEALYHFQLSKTKKE